MSDTAQLGLGQKALAHARAMPAKRAAVCDGASLAYADLASKAIACAARLQRAGLGPGAGAAGLLAAPGLDSVVVILACQLAGVTIVPLPGLVAADAHARMIRDAKVAILFHDAAASDRLEAMEMLLGQPLRRIGLGTGDTAAAEGFDAWLERGASDFVPVAVGENDVSDLIYSSGTTGEPKGITQTYGARRAQCESLALLGTTVDTKLFQTVSLASNFGFSAVLLTLWWGATIFLMSKFSGEAAVEILATETIDMAWCPPAALIRMVETPGFAAAVAGKPCVKSCAGAPLPEPYKLKVLECWPGPFLETYGQTETGTLTLLPLHAVPRDKLNSVGKPLDSVLLRIIADDGTVLPSGEEGEIVAHTTTMMAGYHQRSAETAATSWLDEDGRIHVRTGDLGRLDEDGYLWLCGRKKDLIISGGYNIYPIDIEQVASRHPAVLDVAVVGIPSARWGESPIAFVTLRSGQHIAADTLRTWINDRVGAVQRVVAVHILAALPRGGMDKILKSELRKLGRDIATAAE